MSARDQVLKLIKGETADLIEVVKNRKLCLPTHNLPFTEEELVNKQNQPKKVPKARGKKEKTVYQKIQENHAITNKKDMAARTGMKREVTEVSPEEGMRYLATALPPFTLTRDSLNLVSSMLIPQSYKSSITKLLCQLRNRVV